jgi:tetratricopeptide (TPR) repeat protein
MSTGTAMNTKELLQAALQAHQGGRPQDAERLYRQVLTVDPRNPDALHLLGLLAFQLGKLDIARDLMSKSLQLAPNVPGFLSNYAEVLRCSGKPQDAAEMCRRAVTLDSGNADAWGNLGIALYDMGRKSEAIQCYERAIALRPGFRDALNNLGTVLKELKHYDAAIPVFRKCIAHHPTHFPAYNNLGNVFEAMGQFHDAIDCYNKVLALDPNCLEAHNNLAVTYDGLGDYDLALKFYEKAVSIRPENPRCHFNLALTLLRVGEMDRGWREYEWRWQCNDFPSERRGFKQPLWKGDDLAGKTLLLYAEQGKGDAIQFARYIAACENFNGKLLVEVPSDLVPLVKSIKGIDQIVGRVNDQTHFDVQLPFLSLPVALNMTTNTLTDQIPYLHADPERAAAWKKKMDEAMTAKGEPSATKGEPSAAKGNTGKLKVGIVWAGNPTHVRDRARSSKIEQWAPLAKIPDVQFFSLQVGPQAASIKNAPAGMDLIELTSEIKDFSDTAAIIDNLDLIISVDTAVIHLAGAMGKPVWMLTPYVPDWRWLEKREDTPWYPTVRLLRQIKLEDWTDVMLRAADELAELVAKK